MRLDSSLIVKSTGLVLSGVAAVALSTESWAQATEITEIVVTTRMRAENLQMVPVAVDAITAGEIERKGIDSLKSVIEQSPSVILDQGFSPQDQRIVIRGLSPTRGRQNVAILQDGIDVSSEAIGTGGGSLLINPRLFDLERVEIVKGPQNALYGRSAFAGAINYVTKKPGDTFEARVGIDVGSDQKAELSANVSGPVTDTLSAGVAGMVWTRDGFYRNAWSGEDMGDQEGTSLSGTVVWHATGDLKVTLRTETLNDEFGITPFGVPMYANAPNPAWPEFNAQLPVPPLALADPDGAGPLAPPASYPFVYAATGKLPDGDDIVAKMGRDPRTGLDYPGTDRSIWRTTLTLDWKLGDMTLTSLTHYADASTNQVEGSEDRDAMIPDYTNPPPPPFVNYAAEGRFKSDTQLFSQELRLQSDAPVRWAGWLPEVNWTVGGLFWNENADQLDGSFSCAVSAGQSCAPLMAKLWDIPVPPGGVNQPGGPYPLNPDRWFRDTEHWSIYGLLDFQLNDAFKLILEARQTWEDNKVGGVDRNNGLSGLAMPAYLGDLLGPGTNGSGITTQAGVAKAGTSDSFFAPKATLQWSPTDDQMYYVSVAQAFKPKGYTLLNPGIGQFDPPNSLFKQEKLNNYEIGAKTEWFDRQVRLNGSLFFEDFKNKQVSTSMPSATMPNMLVSRASNAGKAEVWGAELDLTWFATDNLSLNLNYAWLDTEYKDFTIIGTGGTAASVGNCIGVVATGTSPSATQCVIDYAGKELEGAPDNALNLASRYQHQLAGDMQWFIEADARYQDERFMSSDNRLIFPSYWMADFRLGISNRAWDIIAYVDNAFDDDTVKTGYNDVDIPAYFNLTGFRYAPMRGTIILPDPRTWGLRANYRFGR